MFQVNGSGKWKMRGVGATVCAALIVVTVACGGSPAEKSSASGGSTTDRSTTSAAVKAPASAKVAKEKIDGCAGFTAEAAAKILQISPSDVKASSTPVHDALRICSYESAGKSSPKEPVVFSLEIEKSVEASIDSMSRLRDNAGIAKRSIEGVTGDKDQGPASRDIDGIGDEAIWLKVNGALYVRAGNVNVTVLQPSDIELQQQVAKMVVTGLR